MPRIPRDRSALWIFSGLTAAGVLLVLLEDGRDRAISAVAALFFGGLGLVYWALTRPTNRQGDGLRGRTKEGVRVDHAPLARRLAPHSDGVGVVIGTRKQGLAIALVGCALFVMVGTGMIWLWVEGSAPDIVGLAGIVGVAVFGGFAVLAVLGMVRPFGLALLPDGVLAAQAGGAVFVPWGALAAARELVVFHQPSLALRVVDGHGARFRGVHRLLRPVQRRRFDIDVAVSATSPFPPQPLAAAIEALRADLALRARLNTHGGAALVSDLVAEASRDGGQPPPSDPGRLA